MAILELRLKILTLFHVSLSLVINPFNTEFNRVVCLYFVIQVLDLPSCKVLPISMIVTES